MAPQKPTNTRREQRASERRLFIVVIAFLLIVGGALIGVVYGGRAVVTGLICLLAGSAFCCCCGCCSPGWSAGRTARSERSAIQNTLDIGASSAHGGSWIISRERSSASPFITKRTATQWPG
ncbi:MAG: hypothetical protein HZY76_04430 [Anaerolineae bacterium]|nr:MAG: hypothetical protein HZY76_04430 [Anaerolineae bacterium]